MVIENDSVTSPGMPPSATSSPSLACILTAVSRTAAENSSRISVGAEITEPSAGEVDEIFVCASNVAEQTSTGDFN